MVSLHSTELPLMHLTQQPEAPKFSAVFSSAVLLVPNELLRKSEQNQIEPPKNGQAGLFVKYLARNLFKFPRLGVDHQKL